MKAGVLQLGLVSLIAWSCDSLEGSDDFIGFSDASNVASMIVPVVIGDPIHVYVAIRNQLLQEPPASGALGIFVEEMDGTWIERLPNDDDEDGVWRFQYVVFQSISEDRSTGYEIVDGSATLALSSDSFVMSGRFDFVDMEQGEFIEAPPDFSTPGGGERPPGFDSISELTLYNTGADGPPNYQVSGSLSIIYNGVPSTSTYTVEVKSVRSDAEDPFADDAQGFFDVVIDDRLVPIPVDFTRSFNGSETVSSGGLATYQLTDIY